ncbi:MAG: proprotein convertase P-domain-containing protein [Verrucomicrobia bacterium]|nr:proprotein convertase P-domain-containing protein [Verrucomicrobiota bacterium]
MRTRLQPARADVASAVSSATPLDLRAGLLTVKSTDVPKTLADNALATSSLVVGNFAGTIADVNVSLDLTHPNTGDLTAWLVGPQGTRVKLLGKTGGSGDNFTGTVLDDEAGTANASGTQIYRDRLTKVANHLVDHYLQWSTDGVRWFTGGLVFRIVEDHADYWLMEAVLALNGQPPVQFRQVARRDVVYSHWIYEEGAAFSQRGQYQDPNGDRIPNAVAYALGLPAVGPVPAAALARLPKAVLERTPESRGGIVLGLPERMQPDVTLSIEASPGLTAGTWAEVARRTGTGAWQLSSARHPALRTQRSGGVEVTTFTEDLAAQRFYRLRAEVSE